MNRLKPIAVIDLEQPQQVFYFNTVEKAKEGIVCMPTAMQTPHIFTLYEVGAAMAAYDWALLTDTATNLREIHKDKVVEELPTLRKGRYTQREVDIIEQSLGEGKAIKEIAAGLHRRYDSVRLKATHAGFRTPTRRRK